MKRPSLQFLAAVAAAVSPESATMSSLRPYRGGRTQWRRGFSDRSDGDGEGEGHFVTGDLHFRSVRESNLGIRAVERPFQPRPPPSHFNYPSPPPPPPFYRGPSFRGPPPPPLSSGQTFNAAPSFNHNETFRPPQQFRPRPQKPLDYRHWEFAKSGPPPHCEQFKVLSYNLLAEYLAINHRSKLYFHIPRYVLDWDWRKRNIIFELGLWSADILCFQEIDRFYDLEVDLKLRGYSGIWKMRTGDPVDGCAIFWRVSRFKLLHEECVEFNKLGLRDNVAQICVLELVNQNNDIDLPDSPVRLPSSNKIVVGNIHVLYNPKRGEIKLGQVRVLLDRAHAVSKHWDNAAVVLCGDFNCTPKSPLYNYISEQKLDLSELPRDKVSGQSSAEIHPQGHLSPNFRAQSADDTGGASKMVDSRDIGQLGSLNMHKERSPDLDSGNAPSVDSSPQFTTGLKMCDTSSMKEHYGNKIGVSFYETDIVKTHQEVDCCVDEVQSTLSVPITCLKEPSGSQSRGNLIVENLKNGHEPFTLDSCHKDICSGLNETQLAAGGGSSSEKLSSVSASTDDNIPTNSSEVNVSNESSLNIMLDRDMENLSLDGFHEPNVGDENIKEDSSTFLSELHDGNDSLSDGIKFEPVDEVKYLYDPSAWSPMEIESATGSADCTLMEHSLKLRSTYTEVEGLSGTRDSTGEPLVTSYNRCFFGTVDYIWHSEGLQTVRVLAPLTKQAMQWTPGFPTKKWGSDHIALVSELAFTKETITPTTEDS